MTMSDENRVNLQQIYNDFMDISVHYKNQEFLDSSSPEIKYSDDVFPWLIKFSKVMSSSVGCKSSHLLEHLISLYTQNIRTSINAHCGKALDMIKLKNHISSTLTYFHLYWNDIKEFVDDCESYLNAMSVLVGIYIDMELKTSRHTKDSTSLVAKLFSALWIYLNNSEKHIFRVLLKLKHCTKKSIRICEPIIMKSFKCMRRNAEEMWTDIEYVRYLLMLKIWKRMKESLKEIKEVNKMAMAILGPHVPEMRDELLKIIPKPPVGHENKTLWLLQPNVFDLKKACSNFLALEDTLSIQSNNSYLIKNSDLNIFQQSQIISSCGTNAVQEHNMNFEFKECETNKLQSTLDYSKRADQTLSMKKRNKFTKFCKASKLKSGEIILIDLTEDNESLEVDKDKKKKKKCKRKLEWLKMMRKKYRVQKPVVEVKCNNEVEIADAHSTENSKNFVDKVHLEHLPISDNKVSESTESCTAVEEKSFQDHTHMNSQCMHDYISNTRTKELKCAFQHNQCDICTLLLKQNDIQHNRILFLLKFLNAVGQNIKEPKAILNLFRECREQSTVSSQHMFVCKSTINGSREINIQEETFSQPNSSINFKECQERIINSQSIKQELPTSTDCNVTEADNTYCQNKSVSIQNDRHSHDSKLSSISSQISETIKQKLCDSHECVCSTKKIDMKPFANHNYNTVNTAKSEDTVQSAVDDNSTDKKSSICDKNIICMLSDLDKCMDVLNRISEHIVTVHAEKQRLECSDKTDMCAVSTTVSRDQSVKSSLGWAQNTNFTNSEKLSKILELYGKKELLNTCNCKDSHRRDNQETNTILNQLKIESDDCKKCLVSMSQPKDTYFREKTHATMSGNKLSDSFVFSHVKSEFEQLVKEENIEVFKSTTNQSEKANECKIPVPVNSETHANEYFPYDLKTTEALNENVHCESVLQTLLHKSDTTKAQSVEEFENIDILDSILNCDITMEDEQEMLEESQSSLMSPISYDNSNNVLNCITEFFLQAENTYGNDKEDAMPDTKSSVTPLPEGSLGTTGILNSLLDFELTNMNSLPNDLMYSNVQAVNPQLIKKSYEKKNLSKTVNACEANTQQKEVIVVDKNDEDDMLSQKENESFTLSQSNISVNLDNVYADPRESFTKHNLSSPTDKSSINTVAEKGSIYQKDDITNQVQPFRDTIKYVPPKMCIPDETTSIALLNCENDQDDSLSLHKDRCMEHKRSVLLVKKSSECESLSSTDLIPSNYVTDSRCENSEYEHFLKKRNIQKDMQNNSKGMQNNVLQHKIEVSVQPKSSKRQLRYRKKMKKEKKEEEELDLFTVQPNQDELNLKYSQINAISPTSHQDVQSSCKIPLDITYHQKSPHTLCTSRNIYKQLKCVGIQQLRNMSPRKQQILLNYQGDSTASATIKEDSKLEDSHRTMEDNIWEDSTVLFRSMEKQHPPGSKTNFKFSKTDAKFNADVTKVNFVTDKHITDISNNILVKSGVKWMFQNIDAQSPKLIMKQIIASVDEEMPAKRKKLSSNHSSSLETTATVCSASQEGVQKKHYASMKKGLICTNGRKNIVRE